MSCGKKKNPDLKVKPVKAIDAYLGPMYQVLRKRLPYWPENLFLGIISAKYGFLHSFDLIEYYDLKMTPKIAQKHRLSVISSVQEWNKKEYFDLIYILMGKVYLLSVEGIQDFIPTTIEIDSMGGLGVGQQKLVRFLEKYFKNPNSKQMVLREFN